MSQKRIQHEIYKHHIDKLIAAHPLVFNKDAPKALKVGIHREVAKQHRLHIDSVAAILTCWVNRLEYRTMLAAGGYRFDLEGAVVGQITSDQRERAAKSVIVTYRKRNIFPPVDISGESLDALVAASKDMGSKRFGRVK